ncbi:hypothetical protein K438DRAFT_1817940 [Mycena galopus ATCC 62051]|nr:hypothetical protein K438DRAFT_1817940 [Mycena galopus ATCC 62051]
MSRVMSRFLLVLCAFFVMMAFLQVEFFLIRKALDLNIHLSLAIIFSVILAAMMFLLAGIGICMCWFFVTKIGKLLRTHKFPPLFGRLFNASDWLWNSLGAYYLIYGVFFLTLIPDPARPENRG